MENRKQELLEELNQIREQEIKEQLKQVEQVETSAIAKFNLDKSKAELEQNKTEVKTHNFITKGDFIIKFLMAVAISAAFIYIVIQGNMNGVNEEYSFKSEDDAMFQLLSVVGPLFGLVLSYYFGKSKSSANGE